MPLKNYSHRAVYDRALRRFKSPIPFSLEPSAVQTTLTPWLWRCQLVALAASALAVLAFRGQWLGWRPALLANAFFLATVVLIGFVSLLILFAKLRAGSQLGVTRHCLLATALSLPVLIGILLLGMRGAKAPPIHDISTDTLNPPTLAAAASQRRPGDNPVVYAGAELAKQQQQAYADIAPLLSPLPPAQAFERCLAVARELNWQIIAQDREKGLIEAVDRSRIFGFIDDIALRISVHETGSRIDLRSASRAGVSDLGVNAERIRRFSHQFNTNPSTRP